MLRNFISPRNGKYSSMSILIQMFVFGTTLLLTIIAVFQLIAYVF